MRDKTKKVRWQPVWGTVRVQILCLTSSGPLPSPAENGGLFFEINRGFLAWKTPSRIEDIYLLC